MFSGVTVSDNASGATEQIALHVVDATGANSDAQGQFEQITTTVPGLTLRETSPGIYTLDQNGAVAALDPATLTTVLDGLVFDAKGTADTAIQLTITDPATNLTTNAQPILLTAHPQGGDGHIVDPVTNPTSPPPIQPPSNGSFIIYDQTTGQITATAGQPYTGPVPGLISEFIYPTTDQVTIAATTPNVFIQLGQQGSSNPTIAGIDVSQGNGNNVLDSYANSSFLNDGAGTDQNYLDARALTQNMWSTVVNFHAGDNITLWGVTQNDFIADWVGDTQGAAGYTGLTGVFVPKAGGHEPSVTLSGYKMADLTNGRLTVSYNTINGTPYASIHAT